MDQRPLTITIIGWLFIAFGCIAVVNGLVQQHLELWPVLVNSLALAAGIFILFGKNWARWLLIAWLGFHVGLSFSHSPGELAAHSLFLFTGAFLLFRPAASAYFRHTPGK